MSAQLKAQMPDDDHLDLLLETLVAQAAMLARACFAYGNTARGVMASELCQHIKSLRRPEAQREIDRKDAARANAMRAE